MGRANRLLARGVSAIATSVPLENLPDALYGQDRGNGQSVCVMPCSMPQDCPMTPRSRAASSGCLSSAGPRAPAFSQIWCRLPWRNCLRRPACACVWSSSVVLRTWNASSSPMTKWAVSAECAPFFPGSAATDFSGASGLLPVGRIVGQRTQCPRPAFHPGCPCRAPSIRTRRAMPRFLEKVGGAWPIPQADLHPDRLAR